MSNEASAGRADREWYRALGPDELPEGRVTAVSCGGTTVCLTHYDGQYGAIDNAWSPPGWAAR